MGPQISALTDSLVEILFRFEINVCQRKVPDHDRLFLFGSSINRCKGEIRSQPGLLSLFQLEGLPEPRMSASLVTLKRKLRLALWPEKRLRCSCEKIVAEYGNHVMTCTKHPKTIMHNSIRNHLWKLLNRTCMVVKLIINEAMVEREPPRVISKPSQTTPV